MKPTSTEELAEWVGVRHRAVEGVDVEAEWKHLCETLGLSSAELEAAGAAGCRRFIDIYDRGFRAAEGMCSSSLRSLRKQLGEVVVDASYQLTSFSFVNIDGQMIEMVAGRAGCSAEDVRSYLESDERNPKLFKAFAYYGVHPIGKGF